MKGIKLSERLGAFYDSLRRDGYEPELHIKNNQVTFTIMAEDYHEALDVVGLCWKINQEKKTKRGR